MLPETFMKILSVFLALHMAFWGFSPVIQNTANLYAFDFDTALREGKNIGSGLVNDFNPDNLNQTMQNKGLGTADTVTPRINDAQAQKNTYDNFYSEPADLNNVPESEAGNFVENSYNMRPKYDLTQDSVFGSKCLQTDADGKCTMWSASADLISNTFTDCEKVLIPSYDDPAVQEVCTATNTVQTTSCDIRTFVNIQTDTVNGPCNLINIDYQPGQIYAVCRDYYDYFKVYIGTGEDEDDCSCGNHDGALCGDERPSNYSVVGARPGGARYLGTSYENFRGRDQKDGWDDCTSDRYRYYTRYRSSSVERIFLQSDSPCGDNVYKWADECTVYRLEQCDPAGNNCVVGIQDGQSTGEEPDFTYLTKVSQGTTTVGNCDACTPVQQCDPDYGCSIVDYSCPNGCISGSCPSDAVLKPAPTPSAVKMGERVKGISYQCEDKCIRWDVDGNCIENAAISRTYETIYYYRDPRVCGNFSGSIENYLICMQYYDVSIDGGQGLKKLTTTPEVINSTKSEYGNTLYWSRVYGGPDVKPYLNNWYSKVTFNCGDKTSECQPLIDKGCVLYSQRCIDEGCDQLEYTYNCGGTGGIKDYQVAYNCLGEVKCLGTECKDASYTANNDFAAAASATEVFNQYRADATDMEIFPGEEQSCQSSPKDCCKSPDSGISMGDYVNAARSAISAYNLLSGGTAATWASYADAFTFATTMGEQGTLSGLLGVGSAEGSVYTTVSQEAFGALGPEALNSVGMEVAYESGGNAVITTSANSTVSALATIATVVSVAVIVYAIAKFIYDYIYQCTEEDILASTKVGLRVCHEVGERCASRALGVCTKKETAYCCFNSLLARVLHEQARGQIAKGWGDEYNTDCSGLTPGELSQIDFSKIDLREYMQYVTHNTNISPEKMQEIMDRTKQLIQEKYEEKP